MADLSALVNFASGGQRKSVRQATAPQAAPPSTQSVGDQIGGALGGLVDMIEADGDPLQQALRRSLIETHVGRALGVPNFRLPSRQELELREIQGQIALREQRRKLDSLVVDDVFGALLDNKEALGIDESIAKSPSSFMAAVGRAKQAGLLPEGLEVTHSMLVSAGLESATMTEQERTEAALATTTSVIRKAETVRETVAAAAEGEGALGEAIQSRIAAGEEATGLNLGTGLGTDIDERRGSQAIFQAYADLRSERGGIEGKQTLAAAILQQYGDEFRDQLKNLPTDQAGNLLFGEGVGDAGVNDESVFYLGLLLREIANDTGQDVGTVMRGIGLNYAGINEQALVAEAERLRDAELGRRRADG